MSQCMVPHGRGCYGGYEHNRNESHGKNNRPKLTSFEKW